MGIGKPGELTVTASLGVSELAVRSAGLVKACVSALPSASIPTYVNVSVVGRL